jgi:hypothetical protein
MDAFHLPTNCLLVVPIVKELYPSVRLVERKLSKNDLPTVSVTPLIVDEIAEVNVEAYIRLVENESVVGKITVHEIVPLLVLFVERFSEMTL